ncbi:MAG: hypothetical protein AAB442_00670 [Patescibacteria group bacterium]
MRWWQRKGEKDMNVLLALGLVCLPGGILIIVVVLHEHFHKQPVIGA